MFFFAARGVSKAGLGVDAVVDDGGEGVWRVLVGGQGVLRWEVVVEVMRAERDGEGRWDWCGRRLCAVRGCFAWLGVSSIMVLGGGAHFCQLTDVEEFIRASGVFGFSFLGCW